MPDTTYRDSGNKVNPLLSIGTVQIDALCGLDFHQQRGMTGLGQIGQKKLTVRDGLHSYQ